MLYLSAAYLVTFKMVLLFATSEAEINMQEAKSKVTGLLNNFIGTYFDFEIKTFDDLLIGAGILTRDGMFNGYLTEIAKDKSIGERMLKKIDDYMKNFKELLDEAKIRRNQEHFIPMFWNLEKLRPQPESTSGSEKADEPDISVSGFRIDLGKQEVKSLLEVFLQLGFDKKCNDIQSLANFANSLLDNTNLYTVVLRMLSKQDSKSTILSHIDEYERDFRQILGNDYDDECIPMKEKLSKIRENSVNLMARFPGE